VIAVAAACAAGTTMRASQNETDDQEAVTLAPTPEESDTAPVSAAQPGEAPSPNAAPSPSQDRGYAPYGSNAVLEIRRIGQWSRTGINESRRLVIRDANSWAEFWSELGVGERPEVDFARNVVVAVAAGQRPSGGYEIAVDKVSQKDSALEVQVVETAPGPNCLTASSLTQPADVVVVQDVAPKSWSFMERKEIRGCR
jgi:hypothetical protein